MEPVFGADLDAAGRDALIARVRARPSSQLGAVERATCSCATKADGRLQPRHVTLRTFCVATATGYSVMPGGLTRVAERTGSLVVSMQRGGGSKDTWVLADGPVPAFSLLRPPGEVVEVSRGGSGLPSRVADDLFWLGRYLARAEGTVRLLRAILRRLASESDPGAAPGIPALVDALAVTLELPDLPDAGVDLGAVERVVTDLVRAPARRSSRCSRCSTASCSRSPPSTASSATA